MTRKYKTKSLRKYKDLSSLSATKLLTPQHWQPQRWHRGTTLQLCQHFNQMAALAPWHHIAAVPTLQSDGSAGTVAPHCSCANTSISWQRWHRGITLQPCQHFNQMAALAPWHHIAAVPTLQSDGSAGTVASHCSCANATIRWQ